MELLIRPMNEQDWPDIAEIYRQGIATGKATFQSEIPEYKDWNTSHLSICRFVAIIDEKVAGWVALSGVSSRCVYQGVAEVSVYIAGVNRNNGVGQKLLNYLIKQSEKDGIWTLQSGVMDDNLASIHLHEICGFRNVGYREKIGRDISGHWRNTVLMERRSGSVGID